MGRKKKKKLQPIIFCYYCDRDFDNEKVLIQHQRAKHFKCPHCNKRLGSAQGMSIHVFQVHKATVDEVPSANKGRDSFDIEIFGMVGVPFSIIEKKRMKLMGEPTAKRQNVGPGQQPPMMMPHQQIAPPFGMVPPPYGAPGPAVVYRGPGAPPYRGGPPPMGGHRMPPQHQPGLPPLPGYNRLPPPGQAPGLPMRPMPGGGMPRNGSSPFAPRQQQPPLMQSPQFQQPPRSDGRPQPSIQPPRAFSQGPPGGQPGSDLNINRPLGSYNRGGSGGPPTNAVEVQKKGRKKTINVYENEQESMEELRARLPKYQPPVARRDEMHLNRLQSSIQQRLARLT